MTRKVSAALALLALSASSCLSSYGRATSTGVFPGMRQYSGVTSGGIPLGVDGLIAISDFPPSLALDLILLPLDLVNEAKLRNTSLPAAPGLPNAADGEPLR